MRYAKINILKITICFMMISIIAFNEFECKVYADAGSLTVAGGSIAVGGIGAGALAGLAGPVVVAVFLAGMAWGANVELTRASEQAGMTKTAFVQSKINQYCSEANKTVGVFNDAILSGMNVLNDGRIALGNQACTQIKQFYNWLFESDNVQESTANAKTTVNINGVTYPVLEPGESTEIFTENGVLRTLTYNTGVDPVAVVPAKSSSNSNIIYYYVVSCNPFDVSQMTFTSRENSNYNPSSYALYNIVYTAVTQGMYANRITSSIPVFNGTINDFASTVTSPFDLVDVGNDTFTGNRDDWASGSNVLDPSAGQTTVINPGLTDQVTIPADKDYTIDVRSYLEALQKLLDKLNDISIPAVDDATDVPEDLDIPDTLVLDPEIDKEDDTDLPAEDERTPVINDDPADPDADPGLTQAPLKFDIKNIFPFCIPFDVKDMLTMLSTEPVAPSYTVNWHIPIVNTNLQFTVDLSSFNGVAAVCRRMELLLVIIGLAIATRSIFIRS